MVGIVMDAGENFSVTKKREVETKKGEPKLPLGL